MFCTKCGNQIPDGGECPFCQTAKKDDFAIILGKAVDKSMKFIDGAKSNLNEASKDADANAYERDKLIVPDCICANEGEVSIKQYDFAKLRTILTLSFAECRLQVTNKRLLIRAPGKSPTGRTVYHQEFKVNEIAGFEIKKGQRFSFFHFLLMFLLEAAFTSGGVALGMLGDTPSWLCITLSIIISLLGIAAYLYIEYIHVKKDAYNKHYILKQIAVSVVVGLVAGMLLGHIESEASIVFAILLGLPLVGIYIYNAIHLIFAPALTAVIKTKGGTPSLELKRKDWLSALLGKKEENCGFTQVLPWKDTELVIKEIGTIIDDLQTIGDAAVTKWKR